MICHRRRFIFVHVRKTGGTALEAVLAHGDAGRTRDWRPGDEPVAFRDKHRILRDFDRRYVDEYFTFSIVRNPWDRAVSRYFWEKAQGRTSATRFPTFRDYVLARRGLPPHRWNVTGDRARKYITQFESVELEGRIGVDRVYRYEQLERDLHELGDRLGTRLHPLPRVFASEHEPYWTYYDEETQKVVEESYRIDVERFGYSFPGGPPTYRDD